MADGAKTYDSPLSAFQFMEGFRKMGKEPVLCVSARFRVVVVVWQVLVHIERYGYRVLSHRVGRIAGYVVPVDAAALEIWDVDIVNACRCDADGLQMACAGDGVLVYLCLVYDQDVGVLCAFLHMVRIREIVFGYFA